MSDKNESLKAMIEGLWLQIQIGNVDDRQAFLTPLLVQIESYLVTEIEKYSPSFERFRTYLHLTTQEVLRHYMAIPADDARREIEIKKIMEIFEASLGCFTPENVTEKDVLELELLDDYEAVCTCRNLMMMASSFYADYLTGRRDGLNGLTNVQNEVMHKVGPIINRYGLASYKAQAIQDGITKAVSARYERASAATTDRRT